MSDDGERRATTTRRGAAEVTERAAPASSGGATVGLVCYGFGVSFLLCILFLFCSVFGFFFFLINASVLQCWVMGFDLFLPCIEYRLSVLISANDVTVV